MRSYFLIISLISLSMNAYTQCGIPSVRELIDNASAAQTSYGVLGWLGKAEDELLLMTNNRVDHACQSQIATVAATVYFGWVSKGHKNKAAEMIKRHCSSIDKDVATRLCEDRTNNPEKERVKILQDCLECDC